MDALLNAYTFFLHDPRTFYFGVALSLTLIVLFWGQWQLGLEYSMSEGISVLLRRVIVWSAFSYCILLPFFLVMVSMLMFDNQHTDLWFDSFTIGLQQSLKLLFVTIVASIFLRVLIYREIRPRWSAWVRQMRVAQVKGTKSDIRVEKDRLNTQSFAPEKYYREGQMFLGMDESGQPIYVDDEHWQSWNQKIIGPTQTGKGVLLGVQLDQAIRKGHTVVFIDPKPDQHGRAIMIKACAESGRPFQEIDLTGQGQQNGTMTWEPFLSGTLRDRKARLHAILDLNETGTDGDFYKQIERREIDAVLPRWDGTVAHLYRLLCDKDTTARSTNLLQELMALDAISLIHGEDNLQLNLSNYLTQNDQGAVLYVRASMKDMPVVRATKALIQELVQSAIHLHDQRDRHLFMVIDESKFFISDLLSDSLATIAGFNANICICYQSILDLLNLKDRSLNAKAIAEAIDINCKLTVSYLAGNSETAEWMSKKSGTIIKPIYDRERVTTGTLGGDTFEGTSFLTQEEIPLITENQARILPERVGVLYQPGELAKLLHTSWVSVDLDQEISSNQKDEGVVETELRSEQKTTETESFPEVSEQHPAPLGKAVSLADIDALLGTKEMPIPVNGLIVRIEDL